MTKTKERLFRHASPLEMPVISLGLQIRSSIHRGLLNPNIWPDSPKPQYLLTKARAVSACDPESDGAHNVVERGSGDASVPQARRPTRPRKSRTGFRHRYSARDV
jgi:hypothetical protein